MHQWLSSFVVVGMSPAMRHKNADTLLDWARRASAAVPALSPAEEEWLKGELDSDDTNRMLHVMNKSDRKENWRDTNFTASTEPSTRLVLVIEGVN